MLALRRESRTSSFPFSFKFRPLFVKLVGLVGLEPTIRGLKIRCYARLASGRWWRYEVLLPDFPLAGRMCYCYHYEPVRWSRAPVLPRAM